MMGTILLVIAFVIEAVFTAYRIITRSDQKKVRSFIRIGALAAFALLTLVSVIQWSSRWYGLAALLLVWAVLGAWTLIDRRALTSEPAAKNIYRTRSSVISAIVTMLLVFIVTTPALIFPQHAPIQTTGKYQIGSLSETYTDTSRIETYAQTGENRKLNVELWYPQNAAGMYPLVIFSHGFTGVKSSNESLYRELASQGYVVCSIDHSYQALYTTSADGHTTMIDMGYLKEFQAEDARSNRPQSYAFYQKWMKVRTGDINYVIDTILAKAKENGAEAAYKLVDPEKIGVMGHSLGGAAALGIGRMRNDVSAVISLEAPFMTDIEGVKDGEFVWNEQAYPIPVLNVYSDSTWSHLGEWKQYAENYALLSEPPANAFNVHIRGVSHLTLTDLALSSPFLANLLNGQPSTTSTEYCLKTINKVALEFFDTYLKGQGEFTSAGEY